MVNESLLLPMLVIIPVLCAGASLLLPSARGVVLFCAAGTLAVSGVAAAAAAMVFRRGALMAASNWLMLDALSSYHMAVMMIVFSISALYGIGYFRGEIERGEFTLKLARRYGGLWFGSLAAMMLVLVSNNIGAMWVGIEATTLLTAFLICIHASPLALEAMWKYLLMCSVGVAIAFTGTLLIAASTGEAGLHGMDALLWTRLGESVNGLNPALLKAGFLFLVIGYGTKAGLAPMHNWLPDAHSQAPAPVSAVFSGFMLNAALYCILRCLPLVEAATGNAGWGSGVLVAFGTISSLVAAVFIVSQHDLKRLLAYSSVEHLGIMALGAGIGGIGCFAAMLHMLNHALCKPLSFLCAGRLGQIYGTHDMRKIRNILRAEPVWGAGLVGGLLTLVGTAPFALFLSEFFILKAALDAGRYIIAALFLVALAVVFIGVLRNAISMAWTPDPERSKPGRASWLEGALVACTLAALLILGVWIPFWLQHVIEQAARVFAGGL